MYLEFGWPQIIYLMLMALGLGVSAARHGQPQKPYNVRMSLLGACIILPILYWGGFFS